MLDIDVSASSVSRAQTYCPCGIGLKELLTGDNIDIYIP